MKKPTLLADKIQYGTTIAGSTLKYGTVGFGVKVLHDFYNSLGRSIPRTSAKAVILLEENVANPLIEHTGDVGETVYAVDKWQGELWGKILGQTKEKQATRRQEYLTEQNTSMQQTQISTNEQNLTAIVNQPSQPDIIPDYQVRSGLLNTGDAIFTASLIIGAALGYFRGKKEYRLAKITQNLAQKNSEKEEQK